MSYAIVPHGHVFDAEFDDGPRSTTRKRRAKKASAKKSAKPKKRRTAAQRAATARLVAANKARRKGKKKSTSKKSTKRKTSVKRSAPKRRVGQGRAVRVRGATGREVVVVGPHPSATERPCPSCGRYHDLREHWSHRKAPHSRSTRTEHSYRCKRKGDCAPIKRKKKKTVRRKKKVAQQKPMTLAQIRALICREKFLKKGKRR